MLLTRFCSRNAIGENGNSSAVTSVRLKRADNLSIRVTGPTAKTRSLIRQINNYHPRSTETRSRKIGEHWNVRSARFPQNRLKPVRASRLKRRRGRFCGISQGRGICGNAMCRRLLALSHAIAVKRGRQVVFFLKNKDLASTPLPATTK